MNNWIMIHLLAHGRSTLCSVILILLSTSVLYTAAQNSQAEEVKQLKNVVAALSRQVMLQQLANEEKIRADGGSGLKQVRVNKDGPRNYYTNSHTGKSVAAIHDHSNNKRTVGQGEGQFVLNGVDFRTRHNDYMLRRPSTKSKGYHVQQELVFPDVPPSVLAKATVKEQIQEMRLWFKAWKEQKPQVRDYRQYFKPILCYLEGAWTNKREEIEEPFYSDRHALDADSWFDLQEKVRFTGYTGRKSLEENYAYLPTTIINITETGLPVYAQWNYRILCHPLEQDVPTRFLKVVDDLSSRLPRSKTLWEHKKSRSARFAVVGPRDKSYHTSGLLDSLMGEVPGKDNYMANITDTAFGVSFLDPDSKNKSLLNVGYYHRRYKVGKADAMGLTYGRRGFSDPNVFVAETTQPRVSPISIRQCKKGKCYEAVKRVSYAIPLEIIYLTPLTKWNPYDLPTWEGKEGQKIVTGKGKRKGQFTKEGAYNGTTGKMYYHTPTEFFSGGEVGVDPADTVKGSVGVLDQSGTVRRMSASGVRIFLPNIPGVGVLRTRYPIVPIHGEGSSVWKELNALKDIVLRLSSSEQYLYEKLPVAAAAESSSSSSSDNSKPRPKPSGPKPVTPVKQTRPSSKGDTVSPFLTLELTTTSLDPPGEHSHTIELTEEEQTQLKGGAVLDVVTSDDNRHSHNVKVMFYGGRYHVVACDDEAMPCWDGHTSCLTTETETACPPEAPPLSIDGILNLQTSRLAALNNTDTQPTRDVNLDALFAQHLLSSSALSSSSSSSLSSSSPSDSSLLQLVGSTGPRTQRPDGVTPVPGHFDLPPGVGTPVNINRYVPPNNGGILGQYSSNQRRLFQTLFGV